MNERRPPPTITSAVAVRPAPGEQHCGDQAVVEPTASPALLAVVDGLGHGPHAQTAATAAVDVIRSRSSNDPGEVVRSCHRALRTTRGAAISLMVIDGAELEWLAVGNVHGVVRRAATAQTRRLVTRGGIVGSRLPPLRATGLTLEPGDTVAIYTDGVDDRAGADLGGGLDPAELAADLLERHGHGTDDALVLVARYGRGPS
jgi:phosphoserine phosphatase RsbX